MPFSYCPCYQHDTLISAPRDDISRGLMTRAIWKSPCINLFITYFNIELKRTKLNSHTHTHQTMRDDSSPDMEKVMHCSIYKDAWYNVVLFIKRLDIMLSEFSPDVCPWAAIAVALRCLRMGKIDVITYTYVIKDDNISM